MARYVELQLTSHFSFLRGASSPEALFAAATLQGHEALGLADWGSVAGVVRGWEAQKATGVRMIPGARDALTAGRAQLGRASGRERGCPDLWYSGARGSLKKKKIQTPQHK